MNYDPELKRDLDLQLAEGTIQFWARRYFIPGYEFDDLCQEGRMILFRKWAKFDLDRSSFRTWADRVVHNRFRDLLRQSFYNNRMVWHKIAEFPGDYTPDFEDIDELLDRIHENGGNLADFL